MTVEMVGVASANPGVTKKKNKKTKHIKEEKKRKKSVKRKDKGKKKTEQEKRLGERGGECHGYCK